MLMVIFGAGASVPRLRLLSGGWNFEAELEQLRSEGAADPQRHIQLNAIRFYHTCG